MDNEMIKKVEEIATNVKVINTMELVSASTKNLADAIAATNRLIPKIAALFTEVCDIRSYLLMKKLNATWEKYLQS